MNKSDWIASAREILISEGVSGLSLRRISARLNATTGAFYWLFSNLEDLKERLREDWEKNNSAGFDRVFGDSDLTCYEKYVEYVRLLLSEEEYDPKYDGAIRDWAHSCDRTAEVLNRVDARRIRQLEGMFREMGFNKRSAHVRALMTYFHQSGYYRMEIDETIEDRLANIPYYAEILVGPGFISDTMSTEELRDLVFRRG